MDEGGEMSKYERDELRRTLAEHWARMDELSRRLNALEGNAQPNITTSRCDLCGDSEDLFAFPVTSDGWASVCCKCLKLIRGHDKPKEAPAPEPTNMPECGLCGSKIMPHEDAVSNDEGRMFHAKCGRSKSQSKPAPEPTSDTLWWLDEHGLHIPTRAQVEAEAVRLGLLDTPRQKVAEAFLHAALANHYSDTENEPINIAAILDGIASKIPCIEVGYQIYRDRLNRMAAVLERAAKGEG
jgi:hypothetical protein